MRLVAHLSNYIERGIDSVHRFHYLTVPGVTFLMTSAVWLVGRVFPELPVTLVFPFLGFLVAAFWWGNLTSALLGCLVISAYTLIESGYDAWRALNVVGASLIGAFLVIAAKESLIHEIRQAERGSQSLALVDAADKTLADMRSEYVRVASAVKDWQRMDDKERLDFMVIHRGRLANIVQAGLGFHQLWLERQELLRKEEEARGGQ